MIILSRRLRLSALLVVALFAAAVAWQIIATRPLVVARLANGSELRLLEVSYGKTYSVRPRLSLREHLRNFFRPPPSQDDPSGTLVPSSGPPTFGSKDDSDHPFILFELHAPVTIGNVLQRLYNVEVSDDQGNERWSARLHNLAGEKPGDLRDVAELNVYPRRAAQLRLRCTVGEEPVEMTIPNPHRITTASTWKPEPFPQVRRIGGREYTLSSVRFDKAQPPGTGYKKPGQIEPVFDLEVRNYGVVQDVVGAYSSCTYRDETGNVLYALNNGGEAGDIVPRVKPLPASEAVWRLQLDVSPGDKWQYAEADVWSLGATTVPAPGELRELSVPSGAAKLGVVGIFFVGRGCYICRNGKVTVAAEQFEETGASFEGDHYDDDHYILKYAPKAPALVFMCGGNRDSRANSLRIGVRLKDREGTIEPKWVRGGGPAPTEEREFSEDDEFPEGPVEVQLLDNHRDAIEFTFAAPSRPSPAPSPPSPK